MTALVDTPNLVAEKLSVVAQSGAVLLDDFSALFPAGKVTVVLGENGAGKSTLLTRLQGIAPPSSGRVSLDGVDIFGLPPRARASHIAALGQEDVDAPGLSVAGRIAQGLAPRFSHHNFHTEHVRERVEAVAAELGLAGLLSRRLSSLSGGERRRVQLARALVDETASTYVLDEPHAGVDARQMRTVSDALRRRAEAGHCVVVTVHDLWAALELADHVVGIACGRKICDGPVGEAMTPAVLENLYGFSAEVVLEDDRIGIIRARS